MQVLYFICSLLIGFFTFDILTNPNKKYKSKLPNLKLKWFQVSPNIKIHIRGKIINLHHWLNLSFVLVITIIFSAGFLDSVFAIGAIIGGIAQGFTFPDWKKIIQNKN